MAQYPTLPWDPRELLVDPTGTPGKDGVVAAFRVLMQVFTRIIPEDWNEIHSALK